MLSKNTVHPVRRSLHLETLPLRECPPWQRAHDRRFSASEHLLQRAPPCQYETLNRGRIPRLFAGALDTLPFRNVSIWRAQAPNVIGGFDEESMI
jgi:hypothetical protein